MSITAYASAGSAGLSAALPLPVEANRDRAQQACGEAVDAAQGSSAEANRRGAGDALADRRTALDALRDRPSVLDRL